MLAEPAGVPVVQRQQNALNRVQAGEIVRDRHADPRGAPSAKPVMSMMPASP